MVTGQGLALTLSDYKRRYLLYTFFLIRKVGTQPLPFLLYLVAPRFWKN